MSKTAHILCVAAGRGEGRMAPAVGYAPLRGPLRETVSGDLWIGPRQRLEAMRPSEGFEPARILEAFGRGAATRGVMDDLAGVFGRMAGPGAGAGFAQQLAAMFGADGERIAYPSHLQIIPYYLFRHKGRFFSYERTPKGGEGRLHGKTSIGVGGHVDLADVVVADDGSIDLEATLRAGGRREGHEELGIDVESASIRLTATIYAIDEEVDTVHLGIVGLCELTDDQVATLEVNPEIGAHAFRTLAEVSAHVEGDPARRLETWTRLVIDSNPLA